MKQETIEEVQRLHTMTVGELKGKYAEVFQEETRSNNKDYLRKKIAWRLQSLDEGGLCERARKRALEIANDSDIRIRAPKRKTADAEAVYTETMPVKKKSKAADLMPGMTLKRVYKNRTLIVTVTEEGFLFDGKTYRSLTAIAKEVTGSMWNGRLFFGLTKHSREKKSGKKES